MVEHPEHLLFRLADRQSADRVAVEADAGERCKRRVAQVFVHAALHDAEQRIRIVRVRGLRRARAQRIDSSIDVAVSSRVAGYGVHSSNAMTMSESSVRWICIETLGRKERDGRHSPATANATPSSLTLRSAPRLNTWNPPESVRIGPSQPMNRCRPPWMPMTSAPGRSQRWNVLPSTTCAPSSRSSFGAIALTVPVRADRHEHRRLYDAVRQRQLAAASVTFGRENVELHREILV